MNEPNSASNWDKLAQDLGAEPAAPPTPRPVAPPPAAPKRERPQPPVQQAKPTDWGSLASSFGLEPPPAPTPPPAPPKAPVAPPQVSAPPVPPPRVEPAPVVARQSPAATPASPATRTVTPIQTDYSRPLPPLKPRVEKPALPDEVIPRKFEPSATEKALGDMFGVPASQREVAPPEDRSRRRQPERMVDDLADLDDADLRDEEPETDRLAGEVTEEGDDGQPKKRRRRRRRGRRGRGEGTSAPTGSGRSEASFVPGADDESEGFDTFDDVPHGDLAARSPEDDDFTPGTVDPETGEEAPAAGDEERTGKRRRRRRRRGGGKKKEAAATEAVGGEDAAVEADFDPDDRYNSQDDIPLGGEPEDGDDEDGHADRLGHRNIPTWDETIGILIATNMEARAKSPGGGRSSGAPRGRGGRGGRGRR